MACHHGGPSLHLAQVSSYRYYLSGLWYRLPLLPACCPERSKGTLHGAAAPAESSSLTYSMRVASLARSYRAGVGEGRLHVDRVERMSGKRSRNFSNDASQLAGPTL